MHQIAELPRALERSCAGEHGRDAALGFDLAEVEAECLASHAFSDPVALGEGLGKVRDGRELGVDVGSEKPKTFETKKEWAGFAGHYHNDSPWYGDTRVVLRKGQLFIDGVQRLVPRPDGKFGIGDPEGPDWVSFESIVDGRAMRLNFSGIVFRRVFTP